MSYYAVMRVPKNGTPIWQKPMSVIIVAQFRQSWEMCQEESDEAIVAMKYL